MSNKALQKELERGLPDPLYFIWSGEGFFLDDALSRVVRTVIASGSEDFNMDTFYQSSDPQEILDTAAIFPLMSDRRLIVLKDFHQFPKSAVKVLTPYFRKPYKTVCMLVLSQKKPKLSSDVKCKVYPLNLRESEFPLWLNQTSREKGLQLTAEAIEYLIEFAGYDAGALLMELDKLKLSGYGKVGAEEVASSISTMREYTSFELVDAIVAGQKRRAFRILKTILAGNAQHATVMLGTLNWHYRQFYLLWQKKGKRPIKMKEKTYRALRKYLPSFNEESFYRIFRSLHEADLGIKSSGRPDIAMEMLLIKLLQKGTGH